MFVAGWVFFFVKQKTAYEMRISDWSQTCALPISRIEQAAASGIAARAGFQQTAASRVVRLRIIAEQGRGGLAAARGFGRVAGHVLHRIDAAAYLRCHFLQRARLGDQQDRKSTRLNSSH